MIYNEWRFLSALGLTVMQQVLLALSTYYIAQAGMALGSGETTKILSYVSLFFIFALLAYVTSSIATFFSSRASNEVWRKYVNTTLINSTASMQWGAEKNKKSIAQWLGGEAPSTINYACNFYLGLISVGLNVVLTLFVFYISVGWQITLAMTASLIVSLFFVIILRSKIENFAGEMQSKKLSSLLSIELTWNSAMFGSRKMRNSGFDKLDEKIDSYCDTVNKYILLEQIIACAPIIIATTSIIGLLQLSDFFTLAVIGTIVAILPRSLQVFGSVHSLSIYLSQFYLVRTKMLNLQKFSSKLDSHDLSNESPLHSISICATATLQKTNPEEVIRGLQSGEITTGRYTITGVNGSGKSSFLKIVKGLVDDSLLMTPETNFLELEGGLSTGQSRIKEIENALLTPPAIVMLDEWDANLDDENFRKIDKILDCASAASVILEVRHLKQRDAGIIS